MQSTYCVLIKMLMNFCFSSKFFTLKRKQIASSLNEDFTRYKSILIPYVPSPNPAISDTLCPSHFSFNPITPLKFCTNPSFLIRFSLNTYITYLTKDFWASLFSLQILKTFHIIVKLSTKTLLIWLILSFIMTKFLFKNLTNASFKATTPPLPSPTKTLQP